MGAFFICTKRHFIWSSRRSAVIVRDMIKDKTASAVKTVSDFCGQHDLTDQSVAVAVSGGPDSMALAHILTDMAAHKGFDVHVLSVDHGLRAESAEESAAVAAFFSEKENVRTEILQRDVDETQKGRRIQESARHDRYALMAEYCADKAVKYLFLAHHADDQMETVLFRLAKGSGLAGLAGMRPVQKYNVTLHLCRPLLSVEKRVLVNYCAENNIPYVTDTSNKDNKFARVRMRKSREILEGEGFSSLRLFATSQRLDRAARALDFFTQNIISDATIKKNTECFVFEFKMLQEAPAEIRVRVFQHVFDEFSRGTQPYGPRLEKIEALVADLFGVPERFKKRSLGGCFVHLKEDGEGQTQLVIEKTD